MAARPLLLLVAPDEADHRRIAGLLDGGRNDVHWVPTVRAAHAALHERAPEVVLLDAALARAVRRLLEDDPRVPVILLGDPSGVDIAAAARASGAVDHLPKTGLDADTLERAIHYASAHRRAVERLRHEALRDALTGLPNRALFLDRLAQSLRRARRRGPDCRAALLFLDLDRFKVVNDSLGHQAGDRVLQAVALRLDAALRPGDTVARMGGDEFTVLLDDVTDPREATLVAERMLATLADPFPSAGREVRISGSIGIAFAGPDADPEQLIRDADVAMYRAKAEGRARHAVFDARVHRRVRARRDMENGLHCAIEAQALQVVFQPIFRTEGGAPAGFEALCRWEVEPREFIPIAEETGLIVPLGRFMLREAARRAAEWGACISVNVSMRELAHVGFTRYVEEALAESGALPSDLRLDVTEPAPDQDAELALRTLADLRTRVGVGAHLDGFGMRASSLRFVQRFPGDAIKVDRALVAGIVTDPAAHEIVKAIAGLAHDLGLEVVGVGVESAGQLERLRLLGCELAQGFHLSAPLGAEAAAQLADVRPAHRAVPGGTATDVLS